MLATVPELLRTKLSLPPVRADRIARPRLTGLFSASRERPLMLVCAPAGYGKTTLLGEWLLSQTDDALSFGWFSIDEDDNDPSRFLTYLAAAFSTIDGLDVDDVLATAALAAASTRQSRPHRADQPSGGFQRTCCARPRRLSPHQRSANPRSGELSCWIICLPMSVGDHQPRRPAPPALAPARARPVGRSPRRRLRFTPEEAARFLQQMLGIGLSAEQIAELDARTEGWIAGLQLVALAMKGREDVSGFIAAFTGSHRFILDYLTEEVLNRQPEDVRAFLLQTSILTRMNGELCDAVTGRTDGQQMLEQIERGNLFLIPLDDERYWYRYHHLFGDMLRKRLHQVATGSEVNTLHRRVSEWFAHNNLYQEAIPHALAGQVYDLAAHLLEQYADLLLEQGGSRHQLPVLREWMRALPSDKVTSSPWLCLLQAMLSTTIKSVGEWLMSAEKALTHADQLPDLHRLRGLIAIQRSKVAVLLSNTDQIVVHAEQALAEFGPKDVTLNAHAWSFLSMGYLGQAKFAEAEYAIATADRLVRELTGAELFLTHAWSHAYVQRIRGALAAAVRTCQDASQLAELQGKATSFDGLILSLCLADLLREQNDLSGAFAYADGAMHHCQQSGLPELQLVALFVLARIRKAQGRIEEALALCGEARKLGSLKSLWLTDYVPMLEAQIRLQANEQPSNNDWAQAAASNEMPLSHLHPLVFAYLHEYMHVVPISILLSQTRSTGDRESLRMAFRLLDQLRQIAGYTELLWVQIKVEVLQACAYQLDGATEHAIESMEHAIRLAEPAGFTQVFLEEGRPAASIIRLVRDNTAFPAYVEKLLDAFPESTSAAARAV